MKVGRLAAMFLLVNTILGRVYGQLLKRLYCRILAVYSRIW